MLCTEVETRVFDLLDGRLSGPDEVRVHGHLETCPTCRARLAAWRQAVPAMRAAAPPAPDFVRMRRMELAMARELEKAPAPASPVRRPWLWWASGTAVAAAVLVLVLGRTYLPSRSSSVARAEAVSGLVTAAGARLRPGADLPIGRPLEIGADGKVFLALGRGSAVRAAGTARLTVEEAAAAIRIRLDAGQLEIEVEPRRAGESFTVALEGGRVEVRGTRFAVGRDGSGSWLSVQQGTVAAYDPAGRLVRLVSSGESHWLVPREAPAPPPPVEAPPPAPSDSCEELQRSCASAVARTRAAIRASDAGRAIAASAAEGIAVGGCGLDRARQCLDELQYLRAEALRLAGRLPAAVLAYRALDRTSASATTRQNALFAAAELERRLGRRAAAIRSYQRALAVSGASGLREEAMLGIMETADEAGESQIAVTAARRYLASYPAGHGASRARALLSRRSAVVP